MEVVVRRTLCALSLYQTLSRSLSLSGLRPSVLHQEEAALLREQSHGGGGWGEGRVGEAAGRPGEGW